MDEENGAKTTDMPVYSYTCIEISLQRTPETPSRTIKGFYNLHINVEYLETLSLEGWTLFHRAISCVMAGLRALSIPYNKE